MRNSQLKFITFLLAGSFLTVSCSGMVFAKVEKRLTHPTHKVAAPKGSSQVGIMDLSVLPVVKGTVEQYLPTPYGNLGGLLLTNGTQVIFSTAFGEAVKTIARPGQDITIRGLKAYTLPLMQAFLVQDHNGRQVQEDNADMGSFPVPVIGPDLSVNGIVRVLLHNEKGEAMGVVLRDGIVIYIRPVDVKKLGFKLVPGMKLYARGMGSTTLMGKALQARLIGQSEDTMIGVSQLNAPPPGTPAGSPLYDYIPE